MESGHHRLVFFHGAWTFRLESHRGTGELNNLASHTSCGLRMMADRYTGPGGRQGATHTPGRGFQATDERAAAEQSRLGGESGKDSGPCGRWRWPKRTHRGRPAGSEPVRWPDLPRDEIRTFHVDWAATPQAKPSHM